MYWESTECANFLNGTADGTDSYHSATIGLLLYTGLHLLLYVDFIILTFQGL
jgi:hypothetical protein